MTLDLDQVSQQLAGLEKWFLETADARNSKIPHAQDLLVKHSAEWEQLAEKVESPLPALFSSIAKPLGPLAESIPAVLPYQDFSVVAVDGSQIDIDRDNPFPCYLINIGEVVLSYGARPDAVLQNRSILGYGPQDLYITDPDNRDRKEPVEGALLNAKRSVEETHRLVELAKAQDPGVPSIVLIDNSLILWGLAGSRFDDYVKEELLSEYKEYLNQLRVVAQTREMAVAGYTSRPGSSSVANLLRLTLCDREQQCPACNREHGPGSRPCDVFADILDRHLFAGILRNVGDASTVFQSHSKIVSQYYAEHPVFFFYFNAGNEIARVEIPEWVAKNPERLQLAQSLLTHQVKNGMGYPSALIEAHEQAVVSYADRDQFWYMLEDTLGINTAFSVMSGKAQSKRLRAL